jgi:hypothetical protein
MPSRRYRPAPAWTSKLAEARHSTGRAIQEKQMPSVPISKEDARLCVGVVKDVARARGISKEPAAIGMLTASVARLYNRGMRNRE